MGVIRDELRTSNRAIADVVANPALRRIFYAFAGSLIGDGVFALSAAVYAYRTGGPTAIGVLAVARYVAIAVAAPFASTLADQYDRRRVMIASDLVRLALVVLAAVLAGAHATRWSVYALVVLVGAAGTAFRPAQASILPQLARTSEEIGSANVVSSTIESVGFFAGPAIAGFLLAYTNVPFSFAFDAATFVWSVAFVSRIRPTRPEDRDPALARSLEEAGASASEEKAESFLVRAAQGFRLIRADHDIRDLVILYMLQCVVAGASAVFTVAIALRLLHIGSSGLGLMESMLGIGGLIGGFVALILIHRARLATYFALGVIVWAAPLLLIAAFPTLASAMVAMWLIGVANSIVDVNAITVLQHVVPNEKLGRVLGAMEAGEIGGMAAGSLIMTALINVTGLREGLLLIGATITVLVLPGLPAMARIDARAFAEGVVHRPVHSHAHRHLHHMRRRAGH